MRNYHIGLLKNGNIVTVQLRRNVDFLDCEIWKYLGIRKTTKKLIMATRELLLNLINASYGTSFRKIIID